MTTNDLLREAADCIGHSIQHLSACRARKASPSKFVICEKMADLKSRLETAAALAAAPSAEPARDSRADGVNGKLLAASLGREVALQKELEAYARGVMELSGLLRRALILLAAPAETVDSDGDMAHVAWWLTHREADHQRNALPPTTEQPEGATDAQ